MVASLTFGDAVGNEALRIQSLLRSRGIDSDVFAESTDSLSAGRARPLVEYEPSPDNTLLLHFSIGSEASALARRLPDKLVLRYHNVTPARWFREDSPKVALQCLSGRRELETLRERASLALGVSEFNRRELDELGFSPTGVLPYQYDPERLSAPPDPVVLEMFDDDRTNFLCVGRVMPHKRMEDVMKVLRFYQRRVDRRSRLLFVGRCHDFERYFERLVALSGELGLKDVLFAGHVSTGELAAYYRSADVLLSMSEHEGFCVPLLEAFQMGIPVIAYDAGAVSETMAGAGLLVHEKRFDELAELAGLVVHDDSLREKILAAQYRTYDAVLERGAGELVKRLAGVVCSSPS
jgi:glycosyltransferase involved in cell wall biosynthesis